MSVIDQGTLDTIERQRRLAAAMTPIPPTYGELAKRVEELEKLRFLDLDLIHRAFDRIRALEDARPKELPGGYVSMTVETHTPVPKARLAELERIEKLYRPNAPGDWTFAAVDSAFGAIIRKLWPHGLIHIGPEDIAQNVVEKIEEQRARIAALESKAVAAEELARECMWIDYLRNNRNQADGFPPRDFGDFIIAKARERLSARASAKVDAAPTIRVWSPDREKGGVKHEDITVPDDGAFKSAEEDAELVAMGRAMWDAWLRGESIGSIPDGAIMQRDGYSMISDHFKGFVRIDGQLTERDRATLRRVRRERKASQ